MSPGERSQTAKQVGKTVDPEREQMGLALARDVMWQGYQPSIRPHENYDRSIGLYPALEAHELSAESRSRGELEPFFLCSALVEIGEGRQAAEFLRFAMESFPADFPKDQDELSSFQNSISVTVNTCARAMGRMEPGQWVESPIRKGLLEILDLPMDGGPFKPGGGYEHLMKDAFHMPYIAKELLKIQDIEAFKAVYEGMSDSLKQVLAKDTPDIMVPTAAGDLHLQLELLSRIQAGKKTTSPVAMTRATVSFWSASEAFLGLLKQADDHALWSQALKLSLDTFNIDSINKPMDALRDRKLWVMMTGMTNLLLHAREAGVELKGTDYLAGLRPIEKVAGLAKDMQWRRPMGDSFDTLKEGIEKLFHGMTPQTTFSRALPKDLAAAMSELTGDVSWKAKASLNGQGKIFANELGI